MTLGDYLSSEKLTHDALARRAGVTRSYVSLLLNKRKRPSPEIAKRIEAATDGAVSAASLLGVAEAGGNAVRLGAGRWVVEPGPGGDVVLPGKLLADLGFEPGELLALRSRGHEATLTSTRRDLRRAQDFVARHANGSGGVVEELIAERRAEAARE